MKEIKEKLVCPICGVEKIFLNIHLKRVHNVSLEEAYLRFGLTQLIASEYLESRKGVGNGFYGKHHSDKSKDKMIMTRNGKHYSKPVRGLCQCGCGKRVKTPGSRYWVGHGIRGLLVGDKNPSRRPDAQEKLIKNHAARGPNAKVRAQKISRSKMGKPRPDIVGENNPAKRPEVREKIRRSIMVLTRRNWQDPKFVRKQMKSRGVRPNKPEKVLNKLLQDLLPNNYKYVGDGEFILGGRCPDFVNVNGQKKIIELFGDYWHGRSITGVSIEQHEKERRIIFSKYGYKTLVIWEHELKDMKKVKEKILEFHIKKTFNDCNQSISMDEMMGQSELCGDAEKAAEMTASVSRRRYE